MSLTIQEMARRSGFSEPTLRYYEKIGLLGPVPRDRISGHRRYDEAAADRVEALACLRSAGMTVPGMRRYLDLLARGTEAAADQAELFGTHADQLAAEIDRLRVREEYLRAKAALWSSRLHGDTSGETSATTRVLEAIERF